MVLLCSQLPLTVLHLHSSCALQGGTFVTKTLQAALGTDMDDQVQGIYNLMRKSNQGRAGLTNGTAIKNIIITQFKAALSGASTGLMSSSSEVVLSNKRRLLQVSLTDSQLDTFAGSLSSAIQAVNSRVDSILTEAVAAAATGGTMNMTAFKTLAQITKLASTEMVAAVSSVAAQIAANNISGALATTQAALSSFSGSGLDAAITRQVCVKPLTGC